jgi:ketosteroid isomerase-like protein
MSQENVEIVRLGMERLNGGDVDGFLQLCITDFEFRDLPALPGSGVFIGHDAFRAWWAQLLDAFEEVRFEAEECIDASGDRVVVVHHGIGRGRGSGADVEMHFSNVWTLSDGQVVSVISYNDHAEALDAAGLRE